MAFFLLKEVLFNAYVILWEIENIAFILIKENVKGIWKINFIKRGIVEKDWSVALLKFTWNVARQFGKSGIFWNCINVFS